ncbi:uncharacterized protein LOC143364030 [Halictus rubicundus]|uniref:uncharacterized protein LOC143364029 n=1 Tax=Halictus rubicundus TaxID=77578 RepID=UPI004035CCC2
MFSSVRPAIGCNVGSLFTSLTGSSVTPGPRVLFSTVKKKFHRIMEPNTIKFEKMSLEQGPSAPTPRASQIPWPIAVKLLPPNFPPSRIPRPFERGPPPTSTARLNYDSYNKLAKLIKRAEYRQRMRG